MSRISYSQFSMWRTCPYKWKLSYIDGHREFSENINMMFGSAMHHVLQTYLTSIYKNTVDAANSMDLNKMLSDKMRELYIESSKNENFKEYTNKDEMSEFYEDGCNILDFFKSHRSDYFSKKYYTLVGIEVPLEINIKENLDFVGYLDIVVRDDISGDIYIYDFKTSTMGWRDAAKKDDSKISQLVLYKKYFSQQYKVLVEKIHVEFIILKRKLYENVQFPQKRVQRFEPPSGKVTMNRVMEDVDLFIKNCFDDSGNHLINSNYQKIPSKTNCRYCEFSSSPELCNKKA